MKRQTILLLIIGLLCMGLTLLTRHIFTMHQDLDDFLIGLGAAFIISSLFVERKLQKKQLT